MRNPAVFRVALAWAVLVVAAVHFVDFPGSVPEFQRVSGGGTLLDAVPAFTEEDLYQRIDGYGDEGRRNYASRSVTVDVVLPLSVFPFLLLLMHRAVTAAPVSRAVRALLLSVPFVYVAFDFLENAIVLALLGAYPERRDGLAMALPWVTLVKRVASMLAIGVPLIVIGWRSLRRFRKSAIHGTGEAG